MLAAQRFAGWSFRAPAQEPRLAAIALPAGAKHGGRKSGLGASGWIGFAGRCRFSQHEADAAQNCNAADGCIEWTRKRTPSTSVLAVAHKKDTT
jgi:hypothetical protein